jgi:uncharacterized phage-associated protein
MTGAVKPIRKEEIMKRTAAEIAAAILQECSKRTIAVSNLKLQKLLYYCEAWSLALHDRSLFNDPIEAWVHGPVVAAVFHLYKDSRWSAIGEAKTAAAAGEETLSHISAVIDAYGKFNPSDLERLTHSEDPWIHARQGLDPDVPSRSQISRDAMKAFYSSRIGQ